MSEKKKAGKRYYWLKLKDDFFTSKRIKKLRSVAGGNTYTIIYLKMLLKALKTDGMLYFDGVMNDFAEELALDLDENADDVRVTIQFLMSVGLIETDDDEVYRLPYMKDMTGSETASAQRVRDHRAKQALQCNTNVTEVKRLCNAEIEKEKEIEIDKEIEDRHKIDYQQIVNLYNETCVSLPRVTKLTDKRKRAIKSALKDFTVDEIKECFTRAEQSDFLTGKSKDWKAGFDWLINKANIVKVLEGNYANAKKSFKNAFNDYEQTGTDYDALLDELKIN